MKISGKGTLGAEREPEAHLDSAEKAPWKLKCRTESWRTGRKGPGKHTVGSHRTSGGNPAFCAEGRAHSESRRVDTMVYNFLGSQWCSPSNFDKYLLAE